MPSGGRRRESRRNRFIAGGVAVLVLVGVGVFQLTNSSSSSGADKTPATVPARRVGVTPTSIKVGVLVTSLGSAGKVGIQVESFDVEQQKADFQAFFDAVNRRGGINGRTIEPVFQTFDPLNEDSMHAACLALTEDAKVFAVLAAAGFYGPSLLCIARDHQTLYLDGNGITPDEYFEKADGLIFTSSESGDRALATTARFAADAGYFKGHEVGVVHSAYPTDDSAFEHGLRPALERLGVHPVVETLSADQSTGAAQIPLAVTALRNAHVDVVFLSLNALYGPRFVQAADAQGYHPHYVMSDQGGGLTDVAAKAVPAPFDVVGLTSHRINEQAAGMAEPPVEAACRKEYTDATGKQLARGDSAAGGVLTVCEVVRMFETGATAAGRNLTTRTFVDGMRDAQPFPVPNVGGNLSFANGNDGATVFRTTKVDPSCKCWMPTGEFRPLTP